MLVLTSVEKLNKYEVRLLLSQTRAVLLLPPAPVYSVLMYSNAAALILCAAGVVELPVKCALKKTGFRSGHS